MKKPLPLVFLIVLLLLLPVAASAAFLGNISISSTPSGANVYVDSVSNGTTLSTGLNVPNMPIGNHTVLLNMSGYQDYSTTVIIIGNDTVPVSISLAPALGSLSFSSDPSGATVYIDSTYKGVTPLTVTDIQYGTRVTLLKLSGYDDWSQNVILNTSTLAVSATLTNTTTVTNGSIYFETNPSGASVYVDNTYKGTTIFTLSNVVPGYYKVLIEESGYHSYTETVKVTSGTKSTVYAKLVASETETATTVPTTTMTTKATITKKSTVKTPTPWPTDTTTPASPVGTPAIIVAIGLAFLALRKR